MNKYTTRADHSKPFTLESHSPRHLYTNLTLSALHAMWQEETLTLTLTLPLNLQPSNHKTITPPTEPQAQFYEFSWHVVTFYITIQQLRSLQLL